MGPYHPRELDDRTYLQTELDAKRGFDSGSRKILRSKPVQFGMEDAYMWSMSQRDDVGMTLTWKERVGYPYGKSGDVKLHVP